MKLPSLPPVQNSSIIQLVQKSQNAQKAVNFNAFKK